MKILLIHEHGRDFGSGAVIATWRLHQTLLAKGIDSVIACRNRETDREDVIHLPRSSGARWLAEEMIEKVTWRLGLRDIHCLDTFQIAKFDPFLEADVVNIHGWHTNFFNYMATPRLSRIKPMVATLHDMWNFTGHCAFSYGCEKWKSGCGDCPHPDSHPRVARDNTHIEWRLKSRAWQRSDMAVVAPSQVYCDMLAESMMSHLPIHQIPNALNEHDYAVMDRAAAREALGLDPKRHLLLFVSASLTDRVKGADLFLEALRQLPPDLKANTDLLLLGGGHEAIAEQCELPIKALGYVRDTETKTRAYAAADVSVLPSRWENQSLVLLESMACGTPVAAFAVGGNPELVVTGETGHLSPPEDVEDYSRGIEKLLHANAETQARLRTNCRALIERNHTLDAQADRYVALFEQLMRQRRSKAA